MKADNRQAKVGRIHPRIDDTFKIRRLLNINFAADVHVGESEGDHGRHTEDHQVEFKQHLLAFYSSISKFC